MPKWVDIEKVKSLEEAEHMLIQARTQDQLVLKINEMIHERVMQHLDKAAAGAIELRKDDADD